MAVWRPFRILQLTVIREILRTLVCVCTCFVRGCEILSPTFEAMSPNPTDSEKAIVKASSARRLGQLFTRDGLQSSAMTSESLSMHNTLQEYPHTEDRQK